MRLEQVLFSQGFGTRHECRGLIAQGRVWFDGRKIEDFDYDVDPKGKWFSVDEQKWPYVEKAVIVLNKPEGYECSQKPTSHPSVMSLLPGPLRVRGVQPVGRLDEDTTGLLLLTDDGALHHRLTHPRRHVEKLYEVGLKHPASPTFVQTLLDGVRLDGETEPVRASSCELSGVTTALLGITSGKYHQVKRMVAAAGNRVQTLRRVRFGKLALPAELLPGQWIWVFDISEI